MQLLFFDVDGVLNRHKRRRNGYCGLEPACVSNLCRILAACPEVQLVISSAWRYAVTGGSMNCRGFEYLMMTYGAPYRQLHQRIHGHTVTDEAMAMQLGLMEEGAELDYLWLKENGCELRVEQIDAYAAAAGCTSYVVLDDLELPLPQLVLTDPAVGLTRAQVAEVVARFG
jgi:hypothetical protein